MLGQTSSTFDANRLITENAVRNVLQSMVLAVGIVPPVFYGLSCVTEFRSSPDLPPLPNNSVYPIFQVVAETIEKEYLSLRKLLGLEDFAGTMAYPDAISAIRADLSTSSDKLLSWSLLYFVYVLVNLNMSLEEYAEIAGVVVRTARRYRNRGISLLTNALIDVERDARRRARLRRLKLPLKYHPDALIGRDKLVKYFQNALEQGKKKLVIIGPSGVGKSAFVSFALDQYLATTSYLPFDFLLWLNNVTAPDQVQQEIQQHLGSLPMTVGEWTLLYRVAIVIDHSSVATSEHAIDRIFHNLSRATVMIVSDTEPDRLASAAYFVVEPLNSDDTLQLADEYLNNVVDAKIKDKLDNLYIQTQGLPREIQRVVASYINVEEVDFKQRIGISTESFIMHALASVLPPVPIAISELLAIFDGIITRADIFGLVQAGYAQINRVENTLILHGRADEFHSLDDSISTTVMELSVALASRLEKYTSTVIEILRQIIGLSSTSITREIAQLWLSALQDTIDQVAANPNGLDLFGYLLQTYGENDLSMLVAYAHGLRKRGAWEKALEILNDVISYSHAETRQIDVEIIARLERSIALRIPGDYNAAIADLHYIEYFLKQVDDHGLRDRIWVQWSQIALDTHDVKLAESYLNKIRETTNHSADVLLLQAEIFFELNQVAKTIEICITILKDDQHRHGSELAGRAFFLLGKCYMKQNEFNQSATMSRIACRYFEDNLRPLLAGRAMNNLAVALMHNSSVTEAKRVLDRAHEIQQKIGDKTGLLITESNIATLEAIC